MRRTLVLAPWLSGLRPSAGSLTTGCIRLAPKQRPSLSFLRPLCLLQAWVASYERPRMNASSLLASPTGLSPYLRFGCLSCRLFYYRLWDLYRKVRAVSPPARSRQTRVFRAGQSACREAFPLAKVWALSRDSEEQATSERWRSQAQHQPPLETTSSFSSGARQAGLRARRPGWQSCQQQGGEG